MGTLSGFRRNTYDAGFGPNVAGLTIFVSIVTAVLVACSGGAASTASPGTAASTPKVDPLTQKYLALVNGYWQDHVTATSGALQVCVGTGSGTQSVNQPLCQQRGVAMLAVQEKFLSDLAS